MRININEQQLPKGGALVAGVLKGGKLLDTAKQLDKASKGAISKAIKASRFTGGNGQWLDILAPAGVGADWVLLGGLGEAKGIKQTGLENFGGTALQRLANCGLKTMAIACDPIPGAKIDPAMAAAGMAYGARLASYRFDKYRTKLKASDKPSVTAVSVLAQGPVAARRHFKALGAIADWGPAEDWSDWSVDAAR